MVLAPLTAPLLLVLMESIGMAQSTGAPQDGFAPAPVVAIADEPPARLHVAPPEPSQLALGRVVIRYRTENAYIRPVFGIAALQVSPRVGHLHITVDDASWRWLDTSNEPIVVNGLPPGPHSLLIELVDPTHRTIDRQRVAFEVPSSVRR